MFTSMVEILPDRLESDNFVIEHFEISKDDAIREMITARLRTLPGKFVRLCRKKSRVVVMSDTFHKRLTNQKVVEEARGDVLIAGFGIGMILVPILLNPAVRTVTVVEISPEVPAMVLPYLPNTEKLQIVYADVMEWKPPKGQQWDTIYFDIWDHISADNYPQMKTLRRRFGRRSLGWMGAWCENECRRAHRAFIKEEKEWGQYFGRKNYANV